MTSNAPPPVSLGRYRVLRRLGKGGMAEVFLAKTTGAEGIEKVLVVKRVLPQFARNEHFLSMFVDEAKVATRLNHPNIVQVYTFDRVEGEFLLAMEFVDGIDLGRLSAAAKRAGEKLPYGLSAYIVHEVTKGLDYAHKRRDSVGESMDIVHRDVSPQNVLLGYDGIVKVADFGIAKAKLVSEDDGVIKGKFSYMSPEQAKGLPVDRRSDVYSLGVLLAELLMGRPMYPGLQGVEALEPAREGRVTFPRDVDAAVPEALDRIVRRALHPDPEQRFQTARSLGSSLAQFLHGSPVLWDAEALEQHLLRLVPRAHASVEDPRVRDAMTFAGFTVNAGSLAMERELRERRRVVVVAGRVRDGSALTDPGQLPSVDHAAARILADLAYKNDAVLSWEDGAEKSHFRYVIGLGRTTPQDALRGVSLAFDVVEALHGLSADLFAPITASLAVSSGIVTTVRDGAGRLLRYAPVEAALAVAERLANEGNAGSVRITSDVFRLVRRDFRVNESEFEDIVVEDGTRTRAYRALGARSREERAVDTRHSLGSEGLVGRVAEQETIRGLYREAEATGRAVFAAVVGELGVGKSALVSAALDSLDPMPGILSTECGFGTSDVPFSSLATLIRDIFFVSDDAPVSQVREQIRAALQAVVIDRDRRDLIERGVLTLLGSADERALESSHEERTREVVHAIELLLRHLAKGGPIVVWLDSLQWADSASLDLLRTMSQGVHHSPVLILMATRPEARTAAALRGVPVIELSELEGDERDEIVRRCFRGADVPPDVLHAIVERAGGNPFHIQELSDALLERGVVRVVDDTRGRACVIRDSAIPISLPSSLEGVVAARLDELEESTRRALRWLAVAGAGLEERQLVVIAGSDVQGAIQELLERGFLVRRPNGTLSFASGVVRQVAYEGAEPEDRRRMHRHVADYFQSVPDAPAARIAHHLEHAGQPGAAAHAYLEAAELASAVFANASALGLYARALALFADDPEGQFAAHAGRERILRFLGQRDEQRRELDALDRLSLSPDVPKTLRAFALNRRARFEIDHGELERAERDLEHARSRAVAEGDRGAEIDTVRMLAEVARDRGASARALRLCDEALSRAGVLPEFLPARGLVLVQKGILLERGGHARKALEAYAEATVVFRRLGIKRHEALALDHLGNALSCVGSFQDAVAVTRASLSFDRETGDRLRLGRKLALLALYYDTLGEAERAAEFLTHSHYVLGAMVSAETTPARKEAQCAMVELHLQRGEVERAAVVLDQLRVHIAAHGPYLAARERLLTARSLVAAGAANPDTFPASAEEAAEEARVLCLAHDFVSLEVEALALLAWLRASRGAAEDALVAAQAAVARLDAKVSVQRPPTARVMLARAFERLGDMERARAAWHAARTVIDTQVDHLRGDTAKARFLATPGVVAVLAQVPE
ncbi:MAG: protein kinase [Sandaracinaceae bacterium]|nr:protein kinase [Sandaracinaceae bacterium]